MYKVSRRCSYCVTRATTTAVIVCDGIWLGVVVVVMRWCGWREKRKR